MQKSLKKRQLLLLIMIAIISYLTFNFEGVMTTMKTRPRNLTHRIHLKRLETNHTLTTLHQGLESAENPLKGKNLLMIFVVKGVFHFKEPGRFRMLEL